MARVQTWFYTSRYHKGDRMNILMRHKMQHDLGWGRDKGSFDPELGHTGVISRIEWWGTGRAKTTMYWVTMDAPNYGTFMVQPSKMRKIKAAA